MSEESIDGTLGGAEVQPDPQQTHAGDEIVERTGRHGTALPRIGVHLDLPDRSIQLEPEQYVAALARRHPRDHRPLGYRHRNRSVQGYLVGDDGPVRHMVAGTAHHLGCLPAPEAG